MSLPERRRPRRRALAHQCSSCRRHWALEVVQHPAGPVVLCRHCGALRGGESLRLLRSSG